MSAVFDPVDIERDDEDFGPYVLKRSLGTGGMAQVFEAELPMLGGRLSKVLAIKRILSFYTEDRAFTELLIDEARLAMRLHHPNIVQTFEIGAVGAQYFIAMEYVDGITLADLMLILKRNTRVMPLDLVLYITMCVASALHFAHTLCDSDGEPLQVIHRDVSPQNIILGRSGAVKLIDFGVAKARDRIVKTRDGAVRGKVGYFSPERAEGDGFDHRADLFSLGIVLFELLTGFHPLEDKGQLEALLALQNWTAPVISDYRSDIPEQLDDIVRRMLEREENVRYNDGETIRSDIASLLYKRSPTFGTVRAGRYLEQLESRDYSNFVSERVVAPRAAVPRLPSSEANTPAPAVESAEAPKDPPEVHIPDRPTLLAHDDADDDDDGVPDVHINERPTILDDGLGPISDRETHIGSSGMSRVSVAAAQAVALAAKNRSKGPAYLAAGLIGVVLLFGVFAWVLASREPDKQEVKAIALEREGATAEVQVFASGLEVESMPQGAAIYLDSQPTGMKTPALFEDLPANEAIVLELRAPGFDDKQIRLKLVESRRRKVLVELVPALAQFELKLIPEGAALIEVEQLGKRFLTDASGVVVIEGLRVNEASAITVKREGFEMHRQLIAPRTLSDSLEITLIPVGRKEKEAKMSIRTGVRCICCLLPLILGHAASAQSLRGQVIDTLTHTPLSGVVVTVEETGDVALTDAQGYYQFDELSEDGNPYRLEIRPTGLSTGPDVLWLVNQRVGEQVNRPDVVVHYPTVDFFAAGINRVAAPYGLPGAGSGAIDPDLSGPGPVNLYDVARAQIPNAHLLLIMPSPLPTTIKVGRRHVGNCNDNAVQEIETLDLEEYVKGVVPAEVGVFASVEPRDVAAYETWKAFAIAARTYALWWYIRDPDASSKGYHLDDTACNQRYLDTRMELVSQAVDETAGMVLIKKGTVAEFDKFEYAASCGEHGTRPEYQTELIEDVVPGVACVGSWCGHEGCAGHQDNPAVSGSDRCLVRGLCQWGSIERTKQGATYTEVYEHYEPHLEIRNFNQLELVGYVRELDVFEGAPIVDAAVVLDGGESTRTDATGFYRFDSVVPGPHTLDVQKSGYKSVAESFTVSGAGTWWRTVALTPDAPAEASDTSAVEDVSGPADDAVDDETSTSTVPPADTSSQDVEGEGDSGLGALNPSRRDPGCGCVVRSGGGRGGRSPVFSGGWVVLGILSLAGGGRFLSRKRRSRR